MTSACLQVLAVCDILVLLTAFFRYRVYHLFITDYQYIKSKFEFEAYLDVYLEPFYLITLGMTSFVILLVTFQRFIAIWYPFKVKRYCSRTVVVLGISCALLVPVLLTLPIFFCYRVVIVYFGPMEVHVTEITDFGQSNRYKCAFQKYMIPILWYMLPWTLLAVFNFLLWQHVKQSRVRVRTTVDTTRPLGGHTGILLAIPLNQLTLLFT